MPNFEIKNYRQQRGIEGIGFYCILWVDGVKGAEVIDQAYGGPYHWRWFNQFAKQKFEEYVSTQPLFDGMKPSFDDVMCNLICEYEQRKKWRRACKTKTLYRLKGDGPEHYWELKRTYTPEVASMLYAKYGEDLVEIINKTI